MKRIVSVFLAVLMLLPLAGCKKSTDGQSAEELSPAAVMWTDDFKVSTSMITYFFNAYYRNFLKEYSDSLSQIGIDASAPLNQQTYKDNYTWHDYFLAQCISGVKNSLILAQAAKEAGRTLDDEQKKAIDDEIAALNKSAQDSGMPTAALIKDAYGDVVNEATVRKCMELTTLSRAYAAELSETIEFTDEEYEAYYSENSKSLQSFDYIAYQVKDEDKDAVYAEYSGCTTEEQYRALTRKYIEKSKYQAEASEIDAALEDCYRTRGQYKESSSFAEWVFTEGRKPYDVFTEIADDGTVLTAMVLPAADKAVTEVLYRDTSIVKNIRSVEYSETEFATTTAALEAAQAALDSINAGEGSFEALYAERSGVETLEIVKDTMGDEFDSWIFDEARHTGELGVVSTPGAAAYIIEMLEDGGEAWRSQAYSEMAQNKYDSILEELGEKHQVGTDNEGLAVVSQASTTYNS